MIITIYNPFMHVSLIRQINFAISLGLSNVLEKEINIIQLITDDIMTIVIKNII